MGVPLAFVDTETTGLDPDRHQIWEVALILRDSEGVEFERCWQLPVDVGKADPVALTVGRFYERRWPAHGDPQFQTINGQWATVTYEGRGRDRDERQTTKETFAAEFAELTHGAHLVGAVPSFDDAFLKRLLRANGACPGWHYHLVDVEALAAGCIAAQWRGYDDSPNEEASGKAELRRPPWDSNALSLAVGVDPENFDRHTALGDARWAKAIYDAVTG